METKKEKLELPYLGMLIVNSWNSDGYVLIDPDASFGGHCGNYGHDEEGLIEAKRAALVYCWAKEYELRHLVVRRALYSHGTHYEYDAFKSFLDKKGIDMPFEITRSTGPNRSILFKGEPFLVGYHDHNNPAGRRFVIKLIEDSPSKNEQVVEECSTYDKAFYLAKEYVKKNKVNSDNYYIVIEQWDSEVKKSLLNTFESVEQRFDVFDL